MTSSNNRAFGAVPVLPKLKQLAQLELFRSFLGRATKDIFVPNPDISDPQTHLKEAIAWLKLAHESSPDDGVSWGYSLKGGWRLSYRETSGYIAETFFDLAKYTQDNDAWKRAVTICKWLVQMQNQDGSISDPRYGSGGIVFDTGQVLQGLIRAYEETQESCFLQAAEAAGDWLVEVSDETGRWTKNTFGGIPHVYNTRVAWKLLKLHTISPKPERLRVALANLDWAISLQNNGWFEQCAFESGAAPFTHNIAYTIRGLLEAGYLLSEQKYIDAAMNGAKAVMQHLRSDGFISGQIDARKSVGNYCCLTGNCQMAIIWLKLFEKTGEQQYYESALASLQYVMFTQDIHTQNFNIRGGIKGSQPIWGKYTRLSYPNWATKFFIDGLLLLIKLQP
jgi:uncharacterized protein YyaL (SSP411 family)